MSRWTVAARRDGCGVKVYLDGELKEEILPGPDTYADGCGDEFSRELLRELREQTAAMDIFWDILSSDVGV